VTVSQKVGWHPSDRGTRMNDEEYSVRDVTLYSGKPVAKSTRVTVRTILSSLAEGASIQELRDDFPTLTERAVMAFAASPAEEDLALSVVPYIA